MKQCVEDVKETISKVIVALPMGNKMLSVLSSRKVAPFPGVSSFLASLG